MKLEVRKRIDYLPKEKIKEELEKVAKIFDNKYFRKKDFDFHSRYCKSTKVISEFGSWKSALECIGITYKPKRETRCDRISDNELLIELKRVMLVLNHTPSKNEWENIKPKFSYTTYKDHFGGWRNACKKALELSPKKEDIENNDVDKSERIHGLIRTKGTTRNIPLKLRLYVLKRDNYKCCLCGSSPAKDPSVELHVDHVTPFSKGGKAKAENLRILCKKCNLGKGNDESY